jgi:small-conductance mechanosensitive channel
MATHLRMQNDIQKMIDTGGIGHHISDPRLPVLTEDESNDLMFARKAGYATIGEYHAAIKAQFAAEKREQEAQAETERLLSETHSLAQWWHLLTALKDKRDHLRSGIARLHRHGQSVVQTQAAIVEASKAAVRRLLVSVGLAAPEPEAPPEVDQAALDAALLVEERAAKEAEQALVIANADLATVDRQIASVENRRNQYLRPELDHISTRLTNEYLTAIANLRKAIADS